MIFKKRCCLDCTDRKLGCHSSCKLYAEQKRMAKEAELAKSKYMAFEYAGNMRNNRDFNIWTR